MTLPSAVDHLRQTRRLMRALADSVPASAWRTVPPGASNHVLWNVGHVVVTQQMLHYGLAGLDLLVPAAWVAQFRKGTGPADVAPDVDIDALRHALVELPDRLADDLAAGRFATFREYPTSAGVVLRSIDDALSFNLFHEGLHTGALLALRRSLA